VEVDRLRELVHHRDMSIRTFDLGEGRILVEGRLRDQRHRPRAGEEFEGAFLVHDMVARLTIRGPDMVIDDVEAEMPQHPREGCAEVLPWMKKLVGEKIASGFTQRVKGLVGNARGCAHLTTLLIAMGPVAIQGHWAAYGLDRSKIRADDSRVRRLVNTCYLWREDGPIMQELKKQSGQDNA
jgi:hypothetical protein